MILSTHELGGVTAVYYENELKNRHYPEGKHCYSLTLVPTGKEHEISEAKLSYHDSLVQICINGNDPGAGYLAGASYHNAYLCLDLRLVDHRREGDTVLTELYDEKRGVLCTHRLTGGRGYLRSSVVVENKSKEPLDIYDISSFSLNGLTPFEEGDAPDQLQVHRFSSFWSAEGRLQTDTIEALNLEPSWATHAIKNWRISQVGTMPVRNYFPLLAVEDTKNKVTWAAQLEHNGSWQLELTRQRANLVMTGGLADFITGHWFKTLAPGECLTTPEAMLTAVNGDLDDACHALLCAQEDALVVVNEREAEACPLFNEYIATWGNPTIQKVRDQLDKVRDLGLGYFVIDVGWNGQGPQWGNNNGDWQTNTDRFPNGMSEAAALIREAGMIPGIWFEPECFSTASKRFARDGALTVKFKGQTIEHGERAYLDMSTERAQQIMKAEVIDFLKENNFGYLKIDYNNHFGVGFDGYESLGESIRQSAAGTYRFFDEMRRSIPELVIENCSSGGHRLEPGMMRRASMASFSDAHECVEIPLIAADVQRLILARQSQIWAAAATADDEHRLIYTLTAAMLGRMCISGKITELSEEQLSIIRRGVAFYKTVAPIIRDGQSRTYRHGVTSYRHPKGDQTVLRTCAHGTLAVIHAFEVEDTPHTVSVSSPALTGKRIAELFGEKSTAATLNGDTLTVTLNGSFSGAALLLK